jgi:hypothetical protein
MFELSFLCIVIGWYQTLMKFALGRTGYLANGHMSRHMLIGGIIAL